jgi:hypothetical protein
MLTNLQQPAKHWLADAVENFKQLLAENDDPSFTIEIGGAVIEVRLNEASGVFSRKTIPVEISPTNKPITTMTTDPSNPEYNAKARDSIMDQAPFYDPNHKCNIVREHVFQGCLAELRHRNQLLEKQLAETIAPAPSITHPEDDEPSCYVCREPVHLGDKLCRKCDAINPAFGMSWDWRAQPDFSILNVLLSPYGVEIIEFETNSDQYAIFVQALPSKS